MNLRSVDLNLLVVLDALLDEGHVGRAAERIGLSQPAASAALQRCRHLFDDPLLERGRGIMRPTQKAEALRAPLKALLASVTALVDPPDVPLAEIEAVIRITMADLPALLVVEPLLESLAREAPGIDVVVQPWRGAGAAQRALVEGSTDIAVSVFAPRTQDLQIETLSEETYVVAMRANHPGADRFDGDRWLAFPHIVVSGHGERRTALDRDLAERGQTRRVGLVVPSFAMVGPILRSTNMIALVPARAMTGEDGLLTFEPPIAVDGFTLSLAFHRRRTGDRALRFVADRLAGELR